MQCRYLKSSYHLSAKSTEHLIYCFEFRLAYALSFVLHDGTTKHRGQHQQIHTEFSDLFSMFIKNNNREYLFADFSCR